MAEIEALKEQNQQLQGAVDEISRQNTENIVEDALKPPELDINSLAFADEATQKNEMARFVEAMSAYNRKQLMNELTPAIEFAKKHQSVTYLVFSNDDASLVGYFTSAIKPITVHTEGLDMSKSTQRRLARVSELDEENGDKNPTRSGQGSFRFDKIFFLNSFIFSTCFCQNRLLFLICCDRI